MLFPPVFNVQNTLGALLIGAIIAVCLFGVITVQVYTYFSRFPSDKFGLKAMVYSSLADSTIFWSNAFPRLL